MLGDLCRTATRNRLQFSYNGAAMIPALLTRTFNLSFSAKNALAAARTLSRELLSISKSSTLPGSRNDLQASLPFLRLRAVKKTFPPVAASARPVSTPMPDDAPVTMKTLSIILPSSPSSLMISNAVGRASPGPRSLAGSCASEYLPVIFTVAKKSLSRRLKGWAGLTPGILVARVA